MTFKCKSLLIEVGTVLTDEDEDEEFGKYNCIFLLGFPKGNFQHLLPITFAK